ncbi:hypothetical protein [Nocardia sp. alder85J]|uniref:hypothetical protein n=1 Tax=Nocardia sp. alder85J TaxID=2862949 RepID=UPI001CD3FC9F|nr:hypothetical protein [Nocardia sp. alder85J]MCX4099051.1 hypothetical protein [Nocardia sp. alder85J]
MTTTSPTDTIVIADRYTAVWNEPDAAARRVAVAELWTADGVEYVEGSRFTGPDELDRRVAHAYSEFVGSGKYLATHADDVRRHGDIVTCTIQLVDPTTHEIAWAARVFLVLDADGRIREDYQLTVRPLPAV